MRQEEFASEEDYRHARGEERAWRTARALGVSRRRFLAGLGGAGVVGALSGVSARPAAAQTAPAAPVVKPTPPELFNDYGSNKEMRWEALYQRGYLTPNEGFFVRNHTRTARIDVGAWRLTVDGPGVERPLELGFDELVGLPSVAELKRLLARRSAPIKPVLLDQSLFAGVGNWIADEALFQAGISPHRPARDLSSAEVGRIRRALHAIVALAVEHDADSSHFPKSWLFHQRWEYRGDLQTSRGESIVRETIAGRTAAWVPARQK